MSFNETIARQADCPALAIKKATIKVAVVMQIILFCPFDADVLIPYGRYWCSYAYGSHGHVHGDASLVETCASYDAPPIQSEWFGFYSLKRRSLQTYSGSITYFSQILNVKFF